MNGKLFKSDFHFWRQLINIWSVVFFFMIIADFLMRNSYGEILKVIASIYIGILAIYVGNKEFERWYDSHEENHPGEVFVIIWSVLVIALIIMDFVYGKTYHLPESVVDAYIAVLTILVITNKSKSLYRKRKEKNK